MDGREEKALTLSREDLYELVWSKSMAELAKDFGISDVALAKRCRKLGVPVPGRGYWARVDAGQSPYRPKLPSRESTWPDQHALTVAPSPRAPRVEKSDPEHAKADNAWLAERLAFEERTENRVEVPETTRSWDPVIRLFREELEKAAREMREAKKAAERFEKAPEPRKRFESSMAAYKWTWSKDRGQRLRDTHKSVPFRVSLGTYERALQITNSLALAAKQRGFTFRNDEESGRLAFAGHDAEIHLRITEVLDEKTRPEVRYDGKTEQKKYKVPTGRLRINLQAGYPEGPSFEDHGTQKLEDLLNRVFAAMCKMVVKCWQQDRASQAADRRNEEAAQQRAEAQHIREKQERLAAEECKRRDALMAEATLWNQAQLLRNYVAHIRTAAGFPSPNSSTSFGTAWFDWSLQVATDLDPTPSRLNNASPGKSIGGTDHAATPSSNDRAAET